MSEAGPAASELPRYRLRLFVAGNTVRSLRTIRNLKLFCDAYLPGRAEMEIIDIYQQPDLAEQNQVVAAPTLVKLFPPPVRYVIGDLSDVSRVLRALELPLATDGIGEA